MRLSPPITILAILASSLGLMSMNRHIALNRNRAESCNAALALLTHIEETKTKPLVVRSGSWSRIDFRVLSEALIKNPGVRSHPDYPLYSRAAELHLVSPITDCPNVVKWLRKSGIPVVSNDAWEEFWRPSGRGTLATSKQAVAISMPPISPDGLRSVFDMSNTESSRNSEVRMFRSDRQSQTWKIETIYSLQPPEGYSQ